MALLGIPVLPMTAAIWRWALLIPSCATLIAWVDTGERWTLAVAIPGFALWAYVSALENDDRE
jgi:hypothetical protein